MLTRTHKLAFIWLLLVFCEALPPFAEAQEPAEEKPAGKASELRRFKAHADWVSLPDRLLGESDAPAPPAAKAKRKRR
ncbi:hypothetical protein [Singulisphaera sp. PoT]|uniref:hypothetical protein n=1 Tax=Singulisphaera sp. PoT TaxID=3411797 RepID=UPI003BF54C92